MLAIIKPSQLHSDSSSTGVTTNFHAAAVIDAHGREIPITEAMIQAALEQDMEKNPLALIHRHLARVS